MTMRSIFARTVAAMAVVALIGLPARADLGGGGSGGEPTKLDKAVEEIGAERYGEALTLIDAYLEDNPESADAYNMRGYSLRNLGRYEESHGAYQKALSIDPEHVGALEYLGELYLQTDRLAEAEQTLERLSDACGFFGCEEEDELEEAIEAYKAENQ